MDTPLTLDIKLPAFANIGFNEIEQLDDELERYFKLKFFVQSSLTRSLVSFQANKNRPVYRWYKYKEGFSASLVEYFFQKYQVISGKILDPFAGSGTALFTASAMGLNAATGLNYCQSVSKSFPQSVCLKANLRWVILMNWKDGQNYLSGKTLKNLFR
jgi:hypothetical protein